jgi:hypothetical protein
MCFDVIGAASYRKISVIVPSSVVTTKPFGCSCAAAIFLLSVLNSLESSQKSDLSFVSVFVVVVVLVVLVAVVNVID